MKPKRTREKIVLFLSLLVGGLQPMMLAKYPVSAWNFALAVIGLVISIYAVVFCEKLARTQLSRSTDMAIASVADVTPTVPATLPAKQRKPRVRR